VIDETVEAFLRACSQRGVDFSRTLTLGRQQLDDFSFAEPFFMRLGAKSVDSIDASNFEGATIVADLNQPLPQELRRRFSVVFDGGTLEHVFDIATALRSCLDLVELGGHYVAISPANNWPGHGFYQFSPELMFRLLSPAAGFEMRAAFVAELRKRQRWYAIPDPSALGARLYWRNRFRTHLVVAARRVKLLDVQDFMPQQSDYASRWADHEAHAPSTRDDGAPRDTFKRVLWKASPRLVQRAYEYLRRTRDENFKSAQFTRVPIASLAEHIH
jgi:hypothetical protein